MSKSNNFVFRFLHVVAWIIFVGLCIEAGGLLVNFFFSIYNQDVIDKLYRKLDLSALYSENRPTFFGLYTFILALAILKAHLFYVVAMLMHRIDLSNPFNDYVSDKITKISTSVFSIGIISLIAQQTAERINAAGFDPSILHSFWDDGQAFILMSAVIYIIAVIFKKGVEIKNENDLTV